MNGGSDKDVGGSVPYWQLFVVWRAGEVNAIGHTGTFYANETPYASDHAGGGAKFAFCDGSVRTLTNDTPLKVLLALATRAGGDLEGDNL